MEEKQARPSLTGVPLWTWCGFLHCRVEEGIAEEVQGATKHHSGIVSSLEPSDQQGVLANSVGVLQHFKKNKKKQNNNNIKKVKLT